MQEKTNIDWTEFFVRKRETGPKSPIRPEDAQVCFEAGDKVRFSTADRGRLTGIIAKLNPKRAKVECGNVMW